MQKDKISSASELDAALLSITETLFTDRYDILDGVAIASLGEVQSVLLAHRQPLVEIKTIYCDTASLTSVNLLKVLLAERGLKPEFVPLPSYEDAAKLDNVLLIGDTAIDFVRRHVVPPLGGMVIIYLPQQLLEGVNLPTHQLGRAALYR